MKRLVIITLSIAALTLLAGCPPKQAGAAPSSLTWSAEQGPDVERLPLGPALR